jgi:hypothetical protein
MQENGKPDTPRNVIEQGAHLKYLTDQVASMWKDVRDLAGFIRGEMSSKLTSIETSNGERDRRISTLETTLEKVKETVSLWKGMGLAFSVVVPIVITAILRLLGK